MEHVRNGRPLIGSLLEHGSLLALELPRLEIGFPAGSFHLEQMKEPDTQAALQSLAEAYFGQPVTIRVAAVEGVAGGRPPSLLEERRAQESDRQRRLREDALAHPMVKAVKEIFGSEIVEIKPIDKGFV